MKLTAPIVRLSLLSLALGLAPLSSYAETPAAPAPAAEAPKLDFGDFTSSTITTKAWKALEAKDYAAAIGYTNKCIEMFKAKAVEMQGTLKEPSPKDSAASLWALNDVGYLLLHPGQGHG